ncbi:MAG: transposase InsO family protein [Paracoccaceae bacterium]|jgi:transposase InsO family protein
MIQIRSGLSAKQEHRLSVIVADFTYIWTAEGWLYVALVIDLFSRRVVGLLSVIAVQLPAGQWG